MPRIRRKHFGQTRTNGGELEPETAGAEENPDPETPDDETPDDETLAGKTPAEEPESAVESGEEDGATPPSGGIHPSWTDLSWLNGPSPGAGTPRVDFPAGELDPNGAMMAEPHRHGAYWIATRRLGGRTEACHCGSYRDVGLVKSGNWAGGEPTGTPWERAHLEAVRIAVEQTPELLELQPKAIQSLNQTILKDPPPEAEARDLAAVEAVYELAMGAAKRLMDFHRNNPGVTF